MRLNLASLALLASIVLATVAQVPDPSVLSPLGRLLYTMAPIVIGFLATLGYNGIKTVIPPYDRLPAIVHQVMAPVFAFALGYLGEKIGFAIPLDIHLIDEGVLNGILTLLVNGGIFRYMKQKAGTDGTRVLETSRATP